MIENYMDEIVYLAFLVVGYLMGRGIGGEVIKKIVVNSAEALKAPRRSTQESEVWQYRDQEEKDATIALFLEQVRRDHRIPMPEGITEEDVLDFQRRYEGREEPT